jgi:hypothetical protein
LWRNLRKSCELRQAQQELGDELKTIPHWKNSPGASVTLYSCASFPHASAYSSGWPSRPRAFFESAYARLGEAAAHLLNRFKPDAQGSDDLRIARPRIGQGQDVDARHLAGGSLAAPAAADMSLQGRAFFVRQFDATLLHAKRAAASRQTRRPRARPASLTPTDRAGQNGRADSATNQAPTSPASFLAQ